MTQMTQCRDGHFYDKEQNPTGCPFCGVGTPDLTRRYGAEGGAAAPPPADERTRAYGASPVGTPMRDADQTVALWTRGGGIDPPVGYLICTKGKDQGRDHRIRSGYNNIGRDTSQQICIAGDETISRHEHAKLFYDPKNASFHVMAGNGRSGIYVNGQVVLQPVLLKAFDVLEIGNTQLTFLPFCGERFRWDAGASDPKGESPPPAGPGAGRGPEPTADPDQTRGVS